MKNAVFSALLALCFLGLFPERAFAKHIIGGEITYEYISTLPNGWKRFKFTMSIYRDNLGGGAPFDANAEMAIYRGTYAQNSQFFTFNTPILKDEKVPAPKPDCVDNVPNTDVEHALYSWVSDLPDPGTESYFLVYQRCCRNETIKNLVNPGDQGATYFVELTAAAWQANNNSPTFNKFPPVIICANFPMAIDQSASDKDSDFLTYSFCSPLQGGGNVLVPPQLYSCIGAQPTPPCAPPFDNALFVAPTYDPTNPMGGSPQVKINAQTGLISGTPNVLGQFVVGVCVQEFRNGVLLSTVEREFQFNVTSCTPTVVADIQKDSLAGIRKFVVNSCGNNTVTFQNLSLQKSNVSQFRWQFDLHNGQTFTETNNWNATVPFPDTGFYRGFIYLNEGKACRDSAEILVNVFPGVGVNFDYAYDTCVAGPVAFTEHAHGDGGVNRWYWDFGVPGGTSKEQNPKYLFPIPGDHAVHLRVFDKNNCRADTTATIHWFPAPPLIIIAPDHYFGCTPADIFFHNLSTPIDSTYFIVWDFGDGSRDTGTISPTHRYDKDGLFDVSVFIRSPIGCSIEDTFPRLIKTSPSPVAAFTCDPDSALSIFNNTVHFIDQSTGAAHWHWDLGPKKVSLEQNPTYTFPDTGLVRIRLVVTHAQGCKDSVWKYLDFRPEIRWFMPNAFSPNGDGINDGFYGKGFLDGVTSFNLSIWNRWGEMVFETQDPNEAWNGQVRNSGDHAPAGVYVYLCTFTGPRGEPIEFRGFATLIR